MPYQPVVTASQGPVDATALVGGHSVILGFDFTGPPVDRNQLLGFAIHRTDRATREAEWLRGQLRFQSDTSDLGEDVPSNRGPFQKFYWGDYTAKPGKTYEYRIHAAVKKSGGGLTLEAPVLLRVKTTPLFANGVGVHFNRGVTATPAYLRRFGDVDPKTVPDDAAYRWLSRGLEEALLGFIDSAQPGDSLRVAIYEFEHPSIVDRLRKATLRGVHVEIVFHASTKDEQNKKRTATNRKHIHDVRLAQAEIHPRANVPNISHNKFMVLVRGSRPIEVWTGSTNFTLSGLFLQTNVGLRLTDRKIARAFNDYFNLLVQDLPAAQMKTTCATVTAQANQNLSQNQTLYLSPVSGTAMLDRIVAMTNTAQSVILLSCPFGLDASITGALNRNSNRIVEYGLVNTTNQKRLSSMLDGSINSTFAVPNWIPQYDGRAWDSKIRGNHKIHVKSVVTDPWSANPTVFLGSANMSDESVNRNDENSFVMSGDKRLAAIVASEFLRMFEHYKFRNFRKAVDAGKRRRYLDDDGSWTAEYFDPAHTKFRAREVFSGK
jgi:phosphatidylserine/phosphatidylglycerophosphate/cardiolipin synthase-like enzyme